MKHFKIPLLITYIIGFGLVYPLAGQITLKKYDDLNIGGYKSVIFEFGVISELNPPG